MESRQSTPSASLDDKVSSYVHHIERELKSNSEELGGVIEELEGANEDLKTSNEEVMSMNEELQSANEELETSKEEFQSLNEELTTVNSELLEKVTKVKQMRFTYHYPRTNIRFNRKLVTTESAWIPPYCEQLEASTTEWDCRSWSIAPASWAVFYPGGPVESVRMCGGQRNHGSCGLLCGERMSTDQHGREQRIDRCRNVDGSASCVSLLAHSSAYASFGNFDLV